MKFDQHRTWNSRYFNRIESFGANIGVVDAKNAACIMIDNENLGRILVSNNCIVTPKKSDLESGEDLRQLNRNFIIGKTVKLLLDKQDNGFNIANCLYEFKINNV